MSYQQPQPGTAPSYGYPQSSVAPAYGGYPPPMMPQQQQQQQQQQSTVIINNQPTSNNSNQGQPQNIREWSSGICGCCEDCCSCCYAYWCYQCFLCTLANKMDENCCGPCCCGSISLSGILTLAGINVPVPTHPNMFLVAMRSKIRAQYGIRGGICLDICCTWCCEFCATTQMMRELKHVGRA